MPIGLHHGWGIAGLNISREIAKKTPVEIINREYHAIMRDPMMQTAENSIIGKSVNGPACVDLIGGIPQHGQGPCISSISGSSMHPSEPDVSGCPDIGYTFFEDNIVAAKGTRPGRRWDHIVCGSSWCADILEESVSRHVSVGIQGVDGEIFRPIDPLKNQFFKMLMRRFGRSDTFLVFSGGKFELRKGQDVVIKAMSVIMERHPDVALVGAWHNMWPASAQTMTLSPVIKFAYDESNEPRTNIIRCVVENGIPPERFHYVSPLAHPAMAEIYNACDLGVFPNRCEGGTNLCLMEFMSCGKPVVATNSTGHVDILKPSAVVGFVGCEKRFEYKPNGILKAIWPEPNVDDLVDLIEEAYRKRGSDGLAATAAIGKASMAEYTWPKLADHFIKIAEALG